MLSPVFRLAGIIAILFLLSAFAHRRSFADSPLASYSAEWQQAEYLKCNTAANTNYLSKKEKDIIWILNMVRSNPLLFARTVVSKYPEAIKNPGLKNVQEYKSLLTTLNATKKLPLLYPDSLCWVSAKCHALSSGKNGYVGHDRQIKECKEVQNYYGECCDYGYEDPLDIIMDLLIDEGVSSLGHRKLMLSSYKKIGVSFQPHKVYRVNTVIDFYY